MEVNGKQSTKKRLIDADASLEKMKRTSRYFDVVFDIEEMPTVDAVEAVRCKDCKHRYSDSWCEYVDDDDNFYCAMGERKERLVRVDMVLTEEQAKQLADFVYDNQPYSARDVECLVAMALLHGNKVVTMRMVRC